MDTTDLILPHSWADLIRLLIVGFLGYGANTLPALLKRKQSAAETRKTDAEARQIDGAMMLDMMKIAAQATVDVDRLTREKEFQYNRAEREKIRADLAELELDKKIRIGDGK